MHFKCTFFQMGITSFLFDSSITDTATCLMPERLFMLIRMVDSIVDVQMGAFARAFTFP